MKQKMIWRGMIALLCLSIEVVVAAQQTGNLPAYREIPAIALPVTYSKTTSLVFPFAIKSVDRGSASLLAQKAKGVDNVLQVKAGKRELEETNLTVITSDGKLYSFKVNYAEQPPVSSYSFIADTGNASMRQVRLTGLPDNEWSLQLDAAKAKQAKAFLHKRTAAEDLRLGLKSIYVSKGVMWFTLEIKNNTLLAFRPGLIRFFLKDSKQAKRTTQQETELQPVFLEKNVMVPGEATKIIVVGLPQFAVPGNQHLVIQLGESVGGRGLFLSLKHKVVLKTRLLP